MTANEQRLTPEQIAFYEAFGFLFLKRSHLAR